MSGARATAASVGYVDSPNMRANVSGVVGYLHVKDNESGLENWPPMIREQPVNQPTRPEGGWTSDGCTLFTERQTVSAAQLVSLLAVSPTAQTSVVESLPPGQTEHRLRLALTGKARILILVSFLGPPLLRLDMVASSVGALYSHESVLREGTGVTTGLWSSRRAFTRPR